jgi:hypothetical protein
MKLLPYNFQRLVFVVASFSLASLLLSCGGTELNSNSSNNNLNRPSNSVNSNTNTVEKSDKKPVEPPAEASIVTIEAARLQIAQHGDLSRQYVVKAKQSLAGKPELKEIEDKYRDLSSTYNGWLKNITASIAINDKKFEKSPENKKTAAEADKKEKEFINFVKTKTGSVETPKSFIGLVGILVDAGVKIWKAHKQIQMEQRKAVADYIGTQLKWDNWDDIKIGSETSNSTTSPTNTGPVSKPPVNK